MFPLLLRYCAHFGVVSISRSCRYCASPPYFTSPSRRLNQLLRSAGTRKTPVEWLGGIDIYIYIYIDIWIAWPGLPVLVVVLGEHRPPAPPPPLRGAGRGPGQGGGLAVPRRRADVFLNILVLCISFYFRYFLYFLYYLIFGGARMSFARASRNGPQTTRGASHSGPRRTAALMRHAPHASAA